MTVGRRAMNVERKNWLRWILWWRVDANELAYQVANYNTLRIWKSAKGISALCLALSALITFIFISMKYLNSSAYADIIIFFVLAIFIYFGHKWAMLLAMLIWTYEKGYVLFIGYGSASPTAQIIWWLIYMRVFYLAFTVEKGRSLLRIGVPIIRTDAAR